MDGFTPYDVGLFISPTDLPNVTQADAGILAKNTPSNVTMHAYGFGHYEDGETLYDDVGRTGAITPTYSSGLRYYYLSATSTQILLVTARGAARTAQESASGRLDPTHRSAATWDRAPRDFMLATEPR